MSTILAYDLGAGSGRAIIGRLQDGRLSMEEIHRFSNDPVQAGSRLHWDILRLYHEIKQGLLQYRNGGYGPLAAIGIDTWAVDFGLLDDRGELLGNPYHYRDASNDGVMEAVQEQLGKEKLFERTGLQFLAFNTLFQLHARQNAGEPLAQAAAFLMIPDLLRYWLTGVKRNEYTNASTTQFVNAVTRSWDLELLEGLSLRKEILGEIVQPGTVVGPLQPSVCQELGIDPVPVVAVAEHDTASAVAAVPTEDKDFAYLICGTWSLLGTETTVPVLSRQALEWNFTNEGGIGGTYRVLKNIMGLWLIQECKRAWEKEGNRRSYSELTVLAEKAEPFRSLIDPDHPMFLPPDRMPDRVRDYCRMTGQPVPEDEGAVLRCITESLALKYRVVLERTEKLTGKLFKGLHMVGGGIQNRMLARCTADAIGRPVWAGPVEASALGNLMVQYMALGEIRDLAEGRAIIRNSVDMETYEPQNKGLWIPAYERFVELIGR